MAKARKYVLISAAKDEAEFIGIVLESVARQTVQPALHVVVDDGSKDNTVEIVQEWAKRESFIKLKSREGGVTRNFGSKVAAFKAAYDEIKSLDFDFIGCLDADITLPQNYYEWIMSKMEVDPKLGVASGLCLQKRGNDWVKIMTNSRHVPGAMQFFRRECYETIGGYQSVTVAGVDSLAEIKARMHGWETKSFTDIHGFHHKPIGSATGGKVRTSYRRGMTDYMLGKHPLYVLLKSIRRLAAPPYGLDSAAHLYGYYSLLFQRRPRDVSEDVRAYVRFEEIQVLKKAIFNGQKPY